jgi:hypothetical protein
MAWQEQVANVGLEVLEDGTPAYREIVVTVPRQSGKTALVLAWEVHRALAGDRLKRSPTPLKLASMLAVNLWTIKSQLYKTRR